MATTITPIQMGNRNSGSNTGMSTITTSCSLATYLRNKRIDRYDVEMNARVAAARGIDATTPAGHKKVYITFVENGEQTHRLRPSDRLLDAGETCKSILKDHLNKRRSFVVFGTNGRDPFIEEDNFNRESGEAFNIDDLLAEGDDEPIQEEAAEPEPEAEVPEENF